MNTAIIHYSISEKTAYAAERIKAGMSAHLKKEQLRTKAAGSFILI